MACAAMTDGAIVEWLDAAGAVIEALAWTEVRAGESAYKTLALRALEMLEDVRISSRLPMRMSRGSLVWRPFSTSVISRQVTKSGWI